MTANPERGETKVDIGGTTYVLASTFNSMIALQQLFEKDGKIPPVESVLMRAQRGDLTAFRAVFWAMLRRHHANVTVEQAGDLIDAAGGVAALDEMLNRAQTTSAGTPEDVTALRGAERNPRKAAKANGRRGRIGARLT